MGIPEWALGVGFIMVVIALSKALAVKLSGPSGRHPLKFPRSGGSDEEVADLRQTLETMQTRVAELEERVDFTERLLAKQRDSDRLGS